VKIAATMAMAGLLALSMQAGAHAHLKESQPAEGSVVTAAPANLVLKFSEAARITALAVRKPDGTSEKLSPLPNAPQQQVTVPLPALAPGKYAVDWRIVSDDNHIMSGQLHFTVAPHATPVAGKVPGLDKAHEH
jgi:methionine-rich copper-binding protein CopC